MDDVPSEFWDYLAVLAEDPDRETAQCATRLSIAYNKRRRSTTLEPEPRRRRLQSSDEAPLSQASMFCAAPLRGLASIDDDLISPGLTGASQPTPRPVMSDEASDSPTRPHSLFFLETLRQPESPASVTTHTGPSNVWSLRCAGSRGLELLLELAKMSTVSSPRVNIFLGNPWAAEDQAANQVTDFFSERLAIAAAYTLPLETNQPYYRIGLKPLPVPEKRLKTTRIFRYAIGIQTYFTDTSLYSPIDWHIRNITFDDERFQAESPETVREAFRIAAEGGRTKLRRRKTKISAEEEQHLVTQSTQASNLSQQSSLSRQTITDLQFEVGEPLDQFIAASHCQGQCPWVICSVKLLDLKLHLRVELREDVFEYMTSDIQVAVGFPYAGVENQSHPDVSNRAVVYHNFPWADDQGSTLELKRRILVVPGVPVGPTIVGLGYQRPQTTYPIGLRVRNRDNSFTEIKWFLRCSSINTQAFSRLPRSELVGAARWLPFQANLYSLTGDLQREMLSVDINEKDSSSLTNILERFVRCFTKIKP